MEIAKTEVCVIEKVIAQDFSNVVSRRINDGWQIIGSPYTTSAYRHNVLLAKSPQSNPTDPAVNTLIEKYKAAIAVNRKNGEHSLATCLETIVEDLSTLA